jgi:SAM-dependent methyltransferase
MQPITVERIREVWIRASEFSADKESVYPEHARAQEFEQNKGKRVLEYGCGGGSDSMSYLRRGCDVTFVDIVPGNVHKTQTRIAESGLEIAKSRGLVISQSASIPTLPSGLFELASAHGVIHHISEPVATLQEIRRLLRPGGLFYCMLYTERLWDRHRATVRALVKKEGISPKEAFAWCTDGKGAPHSDYYTEKEGFELLESAGFKPKKETFLYNRHEFRTFRSVAP